MRRQPGSRSRTSILAAQRGAGVGGERRGRGAPEPRAGRCRVDSSRVGGLLMLPAWTYLSWRSTLASSRGRVAARTGAVRGGVAASASASFNHC